MKLLSEEICGWALGSVRLHRSLSFTLVTGAAQVAVAQAGSNEALYRVNVQLDEQNIKAYGETLPLKTGLTLDADVLQERRRIWEWVLEPVLTARQQRKVLGAKGGRSRAADPTRRSRRDGCISVLNHC